MIQFKSSTNFDKSLVLDITEQAQYRDIKTTYKGFRSLEEAKRFATWWCDVQGFAYSPRATASEVDGEVVVVATRWDSCD